MKSGKLLVKNFDARIPKIEIKPKGSDSKIVVFSKMYAENDGKKMNVKIDFNDVSAIEFSVNYFDTMIGAEALGLYEIEDVDFVNSVVKRNFERRREVYLFEGDYDYNSSEPADMLNVFDLLGIYQKEKEKVSCFRSESGCGRLYYYCAIISDLFGRSIAPKKRNIKSEVMDYDLLKRSEHRGYLERIRFHHPYARGRKRLH